MKTITCPAAQDAPAAGFEFTILLGDEPAKELMSATPNVKFRNGTKFLDVYEINPVHTMNGTYTVVVQQALVKSINKTDILTFEYN